MKSLLYILFEKIFLINRWLLLPVFLISIFSAIDDGSIIIEQDNEIERID
ncbi:MAG: hypothetical protein ACYC49_10955 [Ignavibacteriaceae bacterium]